MVIKNCWHSRPVFNLLIRLLQGPDHGNHVTAFVFMAEVGVPAARQGQEGPPDTPRTRPCHGGHTHEHADTFTFTRVCVQKQAQLV